jgi:hypothetical protein
MECRPLSELTTFLTTLSGAAVGGTVVIAAELLRQRSAANQAKAAWELDREARRRDDQRGSLLQLQESLAALRRSGRAMVLDRINTDGTPFDKRRPSSALAAPFVDDEDRVRILITRIGDEQLRTSVLGMVDAYRKGAFEEEDLVAALSQVVAGGPTSIEPIEQRVRELLAAL